MVLGALFAAVASVPRSSSLLVYGVPGLVLLWQGGRLLNKLWWKPRRLERTLHAQGLRGTVREHGKTCFSWFGPIPNVTIADPALVKDLLSNKFGHFEKPQLPALTKLISDGLTSHEGEKWVKHRRILNPAFHLEKLKLMLPAFSACCEDLIDKWSQSLGSDRSCELDVWPELQALTGDVISRTAFGSSYLEGRRIFQLQSEQAERFVAAVQKIVIPELIGKRIQAMKEGETTRNDLLGLLLESNMRHTDDNGQSSLGMTIEDVIEECKVFYLAGMETTSWQDRAREEVIGLFGRTKLEYQGLSRLKTVNMILYEVLRLYPPAIVFSRRTYKEMKIGNVTYPAGAFIEIPILYIHHDPDIWGSDAHYFKPERFADGISKASKDSGAFIPFGWGPRICIGQNFALLERFEFQLAPSYTHAPHTVMTLHPMHGAQIKLRAI
ncbi:hypothetical protein HU200_047459 [Digitaria exilis]|uniref:Cytochrome P450 n=1 Tax=Digitaria exilis TaxID=1010633 RepID=A0A835AY35_9POAL|nr:hypothetical protein HU200_047459 [Digitaria exilis]